MASRSRIVRFPSQFTLSASQRPSSRLTLSPHISTNLYRNTSPIRLSSSVPRVADTSIWTSLIPKFLRNRDPSKVSKKTNKEWNPATFFIFIFLLIGSQAIRMLGLRNDFSNFNRSADAKMELLKDVIARLEKGEKVDVERLIGAAGEERRTEKEWEEVLQEIEKEDSMWRKSQGEQEKETAISEQKQTQSNPAPPKESLETNKPEDKSSAPPGGQKPRPFAFY